MPVVTVDPQIVFAKDVVNHSDFTINMTNWGLVAAKDVVFGVPTDEVDFSFSLLRGELERQALPFEVTSEDGSESGAHGIGRSGVGRWAALKGLRNSLESHH